MGNISLYRQDFKQVDIQELLKINRLWKYGDGFFETILKRNNAFPFWDYHIDRISETAKFFKLILPSHFKSKLKGIVLEQTHTTPNAKLRISFFRDSDGLYAPTENKTGIILEWQTYLKHSFLTDNHGLKLGLFSQILIRANEWSKYKTSNALPYVLAGIEAKEKGFDSLVLLNHKGRIADAVSANVFAVFQNELWTPRLKDGAINGVFRKALIEFCKRHQLIVKERKIKVEDLFHADELFLTNAVRGIQPVSFLNDKKYQQGFTRGIDKRFQAEFLL